MAARLTPPITTGMDGFWSGFGENGMPAKREYLPSKRGSASVHSARMTPMASSLKAPRSAKGVLIACISFSIAPTPTPRISRPPLRTSSVAAALASRIGLWYGSTSTDVPRRTREVRAATKLRSVSGS